MNHVTTMQAEHRAPLSRLPLTRTASILTIAFLLATAALLSPQLSAAANAAISIGPGYKIPNPYRDSIIGGFRAPDGSVLYCLEWGKESPTGPNDPVLSIAATKQYASLLPDEIAKVNYLITRFGQTESNEQAAAVAMAIWMRYPGVTDPFYSEHRFVQASIPNAQLRASIAQRAREMNAEADLFTPIAREAAGTVKITPDAENPSTGEITISGLPDDTVGTLQMAGAVFDTTSAPSVAGVAEGETLSYTVSPQESGPRQDAPGSHQITVDGTFVTPGGPGDEIIVWRTPEHFQDLAQASEHIPDFQFSLTDTVQLARPQGNTSPATLAETGNGGAAALTMVLGLVCMGAGLTATIVRRRSNMTVSSRRVSGS